MRFGLSAARGGEDLATAGDEPGRTADARELAPIDVFTTEGREIGWIAPSGDRTSDRLNREKELAVYAPIATPIGEMSDWPAAPESIDEARWASRELEQLIFVVPPPLPPNRHLRLHRRIQDVSMSIGPWRIRGRAHVRPGAEAGDFLLRGSRRFVPLTQVELLREADPPFGAQLEVLIVNVSHVTEFAMPGRERHARPLVAQQNAPVPPTLNDELGDFERVVEQILAARTAGEIDRAEMLRQLGEIVALADA